MPRCRLALAIALALAALPVLIALVVRPLFPVDETRYLAVAWEMWSSGDLLIPHLNGVVYPDKPPLLFWLIQAGWHLFGVNELWPRLIPLLAAVMSLVAMQGIAVRLWPGRGQAGCMAAVVFAGMLYVGLYVQLMMFDLLVVAFSLAACWAWLRAAEEGSLVDWAWLGATVGLGMLAKGPVLLVYLLPFMVFLPGTGRPGLGRDAGHRRLTGPLLASLTFAALLASWLFAVQLRGEPGFVHAVLFDQSLGRLSGDVGHGRPAWWYLPWLPVVLLPWLLWPRLWIATARLFRRGADPGVRGLLLTALGALVILSAVGGKQVHYLLPILALVALALGRVLVSDVLSQMPARFSWLALVPGAALALAVCVVPASADGDFAAHVLYWAALALLGAGLAIAVEAGSPLRRTALRIALAGVFAVTGILLDAVPRAGGAYDLRAASHLLAQAERQGRSLAFAGHYEGQFNFLGRIRRPLEVVREADAASWLRTHPGGILAIRAKRADGLEWLQPLYEQPYRSGTLRLYAGPVPDHTRVAGR